MRSVAQSKIWVLQAALIGAAAMGACDRSDEDAGAKLAAEKFIASRNAYLAISKEALAEMIRVPVDVRREINDTVAGVSIVAKSVTTGQVGIELIPSAADAQFNTVVDAMTKIDITGVYVPRSDIRIELAGLANISTLSLKPVVMDINGVEGAPVTTKGDSSLEVSKVNVTATGWFQGTKRAKAEQAVWETIKTERPIQEKAIGERVVQEVDSSVESEAGNFLLKFSNTFVRSVREWFVTSGFLPGKQLFQTSTRTMWFSSIDASNAEDVAAAEKIMPPETAGMISGGEEAPIMLGFSESALEHGMASMLAGKTFPLAAISQMLVTFGAVQVPTIWNTFNFAAVQATFAEEKPIEFKLNDGVIQVTARFKEFSSGAMKFPGASIALTYRAGMLDDRNIGFSQVQKPVMELAAAKKSGAAPSDSHVLMDFYREILEPGLKQEFSLPVPDLSGVSPSLADMRLKLVRVDQGWVRVGTSLATLEK